MADLYQWDQGLYTDKLVSRKMLELAFTPGRPRSIRTRAMVSAGLSARTRGLKEIWHSGNSIGFTTRIASFPERKFTVVILTNRNEAKLADFPHRMADWCLFSGN